MHYGNGSKTLEMLRKVAKKTKSHAAQELVKDKEFGDACSIAHELFYEAMEEFKEGEMTWKEAVEDLYKNLKAVDMPMPPEVEEEYEEEEND